MDELVPIQRNGIITLYGRVIGLNGRLGQYEVSSYGKKFGPFPTYSEAEQIYKKLIAPKTASSVKNEN